MFDNVVGIVGWKNSGKTTLVEKLVREFTARGFTVSTIKHAHHGFDIDRPGKDSYRHRAAGASEVLVASAQRWALLHEHPEPAEPSLAELLTHLRRCDLVLVEGFKHGPQRKIEVRRAAGTERLADSDPTVLAVATDDPALAGPHISLDLDRPEFIADFICANVFASSPRKVCQTGSSP